MPVIYYTVEEYKELREVYERDVDELIKQIKIIRNEWCNMVAGDRITSCGDCEFNGWKKDKPICNSRNKYFCK